MRFIIYKHNLYILSMQRTPITVNRLAHGHLQNGDFDLIKYYCSWQYESYNKYSLQWHIYCVYSSLRLLHGVLLWQHLVPLKLYYLILQKCSNLSLLSNFCCLNKEKKSLKRHRILKLKERSFSLFLGRLIGSRTFYKLKIFISHNQTTLYPYY